MREAAIERAHSDQRERAGIDARIVEEELRRAAEGAAEDAAHHHRRSEIAGTAARSDGE